jgi:hypothetical protein
MMRLELDISDLKHFIAEYIKEAYNLETLESNFTYDLIDFDESLFGLNCEVMDKDEYTRIKTEIDEEKKLEQLDKEKV